MTPSAPTGRRIPLKERFFHNDWFFLSSYVLLFLFLVIQFLLIFWLDIFA